MGSDFDFFAASIRPVPHRTTPFRNEPPIDRSSADDIPFHPLLSLLTIVVAPLLFWALLLILVLR